MNKFYWRILKINILINHFSWGEGGNILLDDILFCCGRNIALIDDGVDSWCHDSLPDTSDDSFSDDFSSESILKSQCRLEGDVDLLFLNDAAYFHNLAWWYQDNEILTWSICCNDVFVESKAAWFCAVCRYTWSLFDDWHGVDSDTFWNNVPSSKRLRGGPLIFDDVTFCETNWLLGNFASVVEHLNCLNGCKGWVKFLKFGILHWDFWNHWHWFKTIFHPGDFPIGLIFYWDSTYEQSLFVLRKLW